MITTKSCLRLLLVVALLLPAWTAREALAQAAVVAGNDGAVHQLRIVILDGDNALNNIRQRTAREPVIQVEDENHKPVAGVAILFLVHPGATGAGGTFAGAQSLATVTDATGHATGTGFAPNSISGNFTIEVNATFNGKNAATTAATGMAIMATTLIHQQNVFGAAELTPAKHGKLLTRRFWAVTGSAIAVAGTVVAISLLNSSNGASITAGAGGVTHP